jgi:peptidoglycan/LPS O-acetylase OafA/YrhL
LQPMVTLGQWSLSFYLVHQALFFALMAAFVWLRR